MGQRPLKTHRHEASGTLSRIDHGIHVGSDRRRRLFHQDVATLLEGMADVFGVEMDR